MVAKQPQDTEKETEVSWRRTTKLTMVDAGLPSALRVADRPTIIQETIYTPWTSRTHVTTPGTLAVKVALPSHCVGKAAKPPEKDGLPQGNRILGPPG